jgi:putative Ca2+/H+ antiporter (TMEM165/GDT1 family)
MFLFILMCSEWGDVSQVVAISLAAQYGMLSIIIGGGLAHILSIFIAIILGSWVTKVISEKKLNIISGILFIAFAVNEIYNFGSE